MKTRSWSSVVKRAPAKRHNSPKYVWTWAEEYHWMLEEYCVPLFVQDLKTFMPVSESRLKKKLLTIQNAAT